MSSSKQVSAADMTPEALEAEVTRGRSMVMAGKFSEASDILSDILGKYCEKYGELASECAEAYLSEQAKPMSLMFTTP